jgi:hypothetical protein
MNEQRTPDDQVARFDCTSGGAQFCQGCYQMEQDECGDYVRWEDYARVVTERDQLKNKIKCIQAAVNLHASGVPS